MSQAQPFCMKFKALIGTLADATALHLSLGDATKSSGSTGKSRSCTRCLMIKMTEKDSARIDFGTGGQPESCFPWSRYQLYRSIRACAPCIFPAFYESTVITRTHIHSCLNRGRFRSSSPQHKPMTWLAPSGSRKSSASMYSSPHYWPWTGDLCHHVY